MMYFLPSEKISLSPAIQVNVGDGAALTRQSIKPKPPMGAKDLRSDSPVSRELDTDSGASEKEHKQHQLLVLKCCCGKITNIYQIIY